MQLTNGLYEVPAGKIASVVTSLEMFAPPELRDETARVPLRLERVRQPELNWYRALFRRIGGEYLWASRLEMRDEELRFVIHDPNVEIYELTVTRDEKPIADQGLVELDFRSRATCELKFFGLAASLVGQGAGRWTMNRAIEIAWSHPIERFWVHTCSLDHPAALPFYKRSGFRPYKREIEIIDDPRALGLLPASAAPEIPLL